MISKDTTQLFDPDCSTCAHRVERHPSRRSDPSKPRRLNYVCLVCAKAIGEHGCWVQTRFKGGQGYHAHELGEPKWVHEVPCRKYDKKLDKWVPIDYDPRDSVQCATIHGTDQKEGRCSQRKRSENDTRLPRHDTIGRRRS